MKVTSQAIRFVQRSRGPAEGSRIPRGQRLGQLWDELVEPTHALRRSAARPCFALNGRYALGDAPVER